MKKSTRTISGVTPVAVMTQPADCPGECIYCPTYPTTPQSYTPDSPAVLRGRRCDYDPAGQVRMRLKALTDMGHPSDKVEMIIMGGTFLATPEEYQHGFVKGCYDALNGAPSATLEEAKRTNETAVHRCVGLCLETRPDWCRQEEIKRMLRLGATRVELGVQALDDEIYRLTRRGHTVADVAEATARLKEHAFKVHYHWMPGLPGSTPEKDLALTGMLFDDPRFRPDGLKIYPTMVVAGTELEEWYRQGRYQPYDDEIMTELIADIKAIVPGYVRISRVLRDIPPQFIVGGLKDSLRDVVKGRMREKGTEYLCVRCREYGHRVREGRKTGTPKMVRLDYEACGGREIFLSLEDEAGTLFGLLRMRIPASPIAGLGDDTGSQALVRELHVYGPELPLSQRDPKAAQHRGLGRWLLGEAESITAAQFQANWMVILSGVGAREYYRSEFGYRLEGDYMVRSLAPAGGGPPRPVRSASI